VQRRETGCTLLRIARVNLRSASRFALLALSARGGIRVGARRVCLGGSA